MPPTKEPKKRGRPRTTPQDRQQLAEMRRKAQAELAKADESTLATLDPDRFKLSHERQIDRCAQNGTTSLEIYDREAVLEYLEQELDKGRYLNEILREPGMPARKNFDLWRDADEDFAAKLEQAMEQGYDRIAGDCLHIADRVPGDAVDVQHQRLRVDVRLKLLSKWFPKKYGDSINLTGEVNHVVSPLEQLRRIERRPAAQATRVLEAEEVTAVSEEDCF